MHFVKSIDTWPNANVQLVLKVIRRPIKDVFVFHRPVCQQIAARMVTCALQIPAKCHAPTRYRALLVNAAIIMFALKFATQTTTVCQVKFVMNAEHAKQVA